MDFSLTAEQQALVDTARSFAREHIAPHYRSRDQQGAIDRPTLVAMGRLGLFGIELAEEVGGLGQSCVTAGLVLEALCADDINLFFVSANTSLIGQMLWAFGDRDTVRPWIAGMVQGTIMPSISVTEPDGGSDAANLQLTARRDGDSYVLNGEKASIVLAMQADFSIVFARTGSVESRAHGISSFLVPLDSPGVTRRAGDDHGLRSACRGNLLFDAVRVPASHRLGAENKGFSAVMAGFDYTRALLGLANLAVARKSLDEAWQYAKNRQTFGKPLTEYQGVTFPLAECEAQLASVRLLCLQTLWLRDQGLPHTAEAAMSKLLAPKLAYDIVNSCLLTHGHGGYSKELPFEQRLRDLLGFQMAEGGAQIMKLVISRQKAR